MKYFGHFAFGLFAAIVFQSSAALADYPDRPVQLVVSSNAGGGNDIVARMIAARLADKWKQQVVVLNKPGANTAVSEAFVANAPADGYTILITNAQRTVNAATGGRSAGYDMVNGFAAITQVGTQAQMMVANPKLGVKSLAEFIERAKAQPNKLTYGDYGVGSAADLGTKLFMQKTGTQFFEISYKTQAESLIGVMSGEIDVALASVITVAPQVKAGTVIALGTTDEVRSPVFPDVPTVAEALKIPPFIFNSWYGFFAPAGTSKEIIAKLNEDIVAVLKLPEIQEPFTRDGLIIVGSKAEDFERLIKQESAVWKGVMEAFPAK